MKLIKDTPGWIPDIIDWDKIPIETYKFIFDRSEKRFDDILLDSEVVTERSIKLLSAVVLSISYFIALKNYNICHPIIFLVSILYFINIILLLILIFPRNLVSKGASPKELFHRGIETSKNSENYSENEKKIIPYYYEILRLQKSIDINRKSNKRRYKLFVTSIILSAITLIVDIAIYVLYHP